MTLPVIRGVIARRILLNWRVDPGALRRVVPEPFRPQLVEGFGIAGVCLIRLERVRPRGVPEFLGISSENAAHRVAVEWADETGRTRRGVYIPRRDSDSRLNVFAGGRLFPGVHHHARFEVRDSRDTIGLSMRSDDGETRISVAARVASTLPSASVFSSLDEASAFFEAGALGYSATREAGRFDGLELKCEGWRVGALEVEGVESSFFADRRRFPEGAAVFDCALVMRDVRHEWHGRGVMGCDGEVG